MGGDSPAPFQKKGKTKIYYVMELKIKTNFSCGDIVYFLQNNMVVKDVIEMIHLIHADNITEIYYSFEKSVDRMFYSEKDLFNSLDDLFNHLKNNIQNS